ncbi:glycosyltransferase, partial [mine drainage metagenome]
YLANLDFDIIHAYGYGYFSTEVAAFFSLIRNKPLIFSPCGYFPLTVKGNRYLTKLYGLISKNNSLRRADYVFVDSKDDFKIYSNLTNRGKLRIIPGATLKAQAITQEVSATNFLEKYNIDFPYFFSIGRITPTKGFQNIIKAIPEFMEMNDGVNLKFIIAGADQGYISALKDLASKLGVENS